ncbi:hypothetical protein N9J91_02475 [Gammaproteobacteria bacterium]|nr:hypothetical protein [Gammaproteobacteria bacterium]
MVNKDSWYSFNTSFNNPASCRLSNCEGIYLMKDKKEDSVGIMKLVGILFLSVLFGMFFVLVFA